VTIDDRFNVLDNEKRTLKTENPSVKQTGEKARLMLTSQFGFYQK